MTDNPTKIQPSEVRVGDKVRVTTRQYGVEHARTLTVAAVDDGLVYTAEDGAVRIKPYGWGFDKPIEVELLDRPEPKPEPGWYTARDHKDAIYLVTESGDITYTYMNVGTVVQHSSHNHGTFLSSIKDGTFTKIAELGA